MLHALDETLESFLKTTFPKNIPEKNSDVKFNFDAPFKSSITERPTINLFLYNVQENLELRDKSWTFKREGTNGLARKKRLPTRIDCSYLITAWSDNDNSAIEHQLLGEVMKLLISYPTIPPVFLSEELDGQELLLRLISLRPSNLQSFGEFWQAMGDKEGAKPKVILHCTVTISVPASVNEEETAPLVGFVASQTTA